MQIRRPMNAPAGCIESLQVAFFKGPFPYTDAQKVGIVTSLAIHASLLALLLLIPSAKPVTFSKTIQISLGNWSSISATGLYEEVEPAASKPDFQKKSDPGGSTSHTRGKTTTDRPRPTKLSLGSAPAKELSQNRPVSSVAVNPAVPSESSALLVQENRTSPSFSHSGTETTGRAVQGQNVTEGEGGKIGDRSIVETSFGATGAPAFIDRVMPVYPFLARRLGREGRVILKLLIDRHGKLRSIEVLEGAGYGFLEAAVTAAKQSTYAPAIINGEAVASAAILPVRFRLDER